LEGAILVHGLEHFDAPADVVWISGSVGHDRERDPLGFQELRLDAVDIRELVQVSSLNGLDVQIRRTKHVRRDLVEDHWAYVAIRWLSIGKLRHPIELNQHRP
jgi:hypothetical protein